MDMLNDFSNWMGGMCGELGHQFNAGITRNSKKN